MNRYKLSKAGVNANEGIARFGGDKDAFEQLLINFKKDTNFTQLCAAIEQGDVQAGFSAAHSLKGVSGNLSMTKLYDQVVPLVEELRAGSLAKASVLLEPVKAAYKEVIEAIG